MRILLSLSLIFAVACGDDDRPAIDSGPSDATGDSFLPPEQDADGDGISNTDEGQADGVDTDGDGQPDYLDTDSDNDGLPDALERGDGAQPIDSDGDGVRDFRDEDSDDNGIPDRLDANLDEEGNPIDTDGDGVLDYRDDDDDGDRIDDVTELDGRTTLPRDTDDDGIPNYRDTDSDGDTISDFHDGARDADGDELPNYVDEDSDNDGISDADEAGDDDLSTPPVNTDGDEFADFVDLDSDGDGLSDELEAELGSDPTLSDSDMDGVPDLIEVGGGTDLNDPLDSPRTRGDFVFVVPFREPAMPPRDTLKFRTNIRRADVYFLFDLTGSMIGEITAMRDAVVSVIDDLTCDDSEMACLSDATCGDAQICGLDGTCIEDPETTGCIANVWTGVGYYAGYGSSYRNLLGVQPDATVTADTIPSRANGPGADESLFESAACVSDPSVCFGASCAAGGIGCPAYRRDAVRVLTMITDETNQCTDDPGDRDSCLVVNTAGAAGGRLRLNRVNFVGIDASSGGQPREDLQGLAAAAGSVNTDGEPFYYEGDGDDVVNAVTSGVRELADQLQLFVNIEATDSPGDAGDALQFINRLEINRMTEGCITDATVADLDTDGYPDAFPSLRTGTEVCWDVVVRDNTRVRPTGLPQVFRAELTVFGDGSPLDVRRVFFLVPPVIEGPVIE